MKVSVTVVLEVDTEGWALDYGVEGKAAIRADVKEYVRHTLYECNDNFSPPAPRRG